MLDSLLEPSPVEQCWNQIGVAGDRTCPQLSRVIHCRNCTKFSAASQALLERVAPQDYQDEWADLLAQELTYTSSDRQSNALVSALQDSDDFLSITTFRLGEAWFALPSANIQEVTSACVVHSLPHHQNSILRGIVNIRGEILMCISLEQLLGFSPTSHDAANTAAENFALSLAQWSSVVYPRMIVVIAENIRWVFQVDEIYSVQRIPREQLQPPPVAITKATHTFTQGIIKWHANIDYLDPLRLIQAIHGRLQ